MRLQINRWTWFAICFGAWIFTSRAGEFKAGESTYLEIEAREEKLPVWVPKNYTPDKKWPVLFYYHGTSGFPTMEYLRLYVESRDWVLVGMTYLKGGQFVYTEETVAEELKTFREVLNQVSLNVQLDPKKVYVSGFSKGGWMTGIFLQRDPIFAGGMVMGAGLMLPPGAAPLPKGKTTSQIYIGVGEDDGNVAMSAGAAKLFSQVGGTVLSERWLDWGHRFPIHVGHPTSESLRQWLKVQAGAATQSNAIDWFESAFHEIKESAGKISDAETYFAIEKLSLSPFVPLLDNEARSVLTDALKQARQKTEVAPEIEAAAEYQRILELEGRDRYVTTLAESVAEYQKLVDRYPNTIYGMKAKAARDRVMETLKAEGQ